MLRRCLAILILVWDFRIESLALLRSSEVFAESAVESYLANQKNISEKKETKTKEK